MRTELFSLMILPVAFLNLNCASTSAPNNWLPEKNKIDQQAYGGWITVHKTDKTVLRGELISVSDSGLYVMSIEQLVFAEKDSISKAKLGKYEESNPVAAWGLLGTLSTLSHGFGLIFSAPVWVLTSTMMASSYSHNKIIEYPENKLADFRIYSRFPQGLSNQIDLTKLKPKLFPSFSNSQKNEVKSIIMNNLNKPFQITVSRSFILTESKNFDEYELSGRADVFGWVYLGGGMNYNYYSYSPNGTVQNEFLRKNISPFLEISKELKLGTVNPFISGRHYFFILNNIESSLNTISFGANILIASSPFAVHIEFKKLFLTDANDITYYYSTDEQKHEKTDLNYLLLNLGVAVYF